MDDPKRCAAVLPADQEIRIQSQGGVPIMNFGHPYDAGIGERHRRVPIFLQQLAKLGEMLFDAKRNAECTVREEIEKNLLRS